MESYSIHHLHDVFLKLNQYVFKISHESGTDRHRNIVLNKIKMEFTSYLVNRRDK